MTNSILLFACFSSGAASLFYQILWTRSFALVLGSTVQAAALTFAAFLVGLALGAWLFGQVTARMQRPLRCYVLLEIGIACSALTTGLLLHHHADTLGALLGGGVTRYGLTFLLALLVILPATVLMGATLPLVLSIAQRNDSRLQIVSRFYGYNTLGAAAGTLCCGFVTIRLLGVTGSYFCAVALNLLAALLCVLVARRPLPALPADRPSAGAVLTTEISERYLLLIAGASGAVVLSVEVVWARFAGFLLGNRTYAFTLLMVAVLTLLALGSWLSAGLYRRTLSTPHNDGYAMFANLLAVAALALALSALGGAWLIVHQSALEARLPQLAELILCYRFAEAFVLLALPLVTLGALLPLAMTHSRYCSRDIGRTTASFYVANAIGIVVGSLGTGFIGVNYLGSFGMFKLLIGVLLALMMYTLYAKCRPVPRLALTMGACACLLVLVLPAGYPAKLRPQETLMVDTEDEYGVFRIIRKANGNLRVTNNEVELVYHLGAFSTDYVQQMQGHLGMHFNPAAKEALVIGSGYGITAGVLGDYPPINGVDAVELLPAMVAAADVFAPNNFNYHRNPKVNVVVDDGRHFLVRQGRQYDIITLNVSDPHLPGGASLFHLEFYELVKQRLKPGGVMVQHVFGSERAIIANTLMAAFPYARFSRSYANGYNVVASMQPLAAGASRAMVLPKAAVQQLRRSGRGRRLSVPPFLRYAQLPRDMHSTTLASDDFPAVEFFWNPGVKALFINE